MPECSPVEMHSPEDGQCSELLPVEEKFELVIRPSPELPWYQQVFTCLRPGWVHFMRRHWTLQEVSGAFGDMGLFLPLITALSIGRVDGRAQIAFGPALFFAGIFSAMLATYFNLPIPVQPMKTIAAVAIAEKYPNSQLIAAGITSGVIMFVLATTNIITPVAKAIPVPVVRGIQLAVGTSIMTSGFKSAYVRELVLSPATSDSSFEAQATKAVNWVGIDSVLVSLILGVFCLVFMTSRKIPIGLLLFLFGMAVAVYQYYTLRDEYQLPGLEIGPDFEAPVVPSWHDFREAFIYLNLPQLPLTMLNSVIAVEKLAVDLFPKHENPAGVRRLCFSLAAGNLLFSWFGLLPVCHGAGGLASQYAFGSRSSLSMVFLGCFKFCFALLFGSSCVVLLQKGVFPQSVLGVMLIFSGINLAGVGLKIDVHKREDVLLVLLTAAGSLGLNTGAGFLIGMTAHLVSTVAERLGLNDV